MTETFKLHSNMLSKCRKCHFGRPNFQKFVGGRGKEWPGKNLPNFEPLGLEPLLVPSIQKIDNLVGNTYWQTDGAQLKLFKKNIGNLYSMCQSPPYKFLADKPMPAALFIRTCVLCHRKPVHASTKFRDFCVLIIVITVRCTFC